MLVDFVVGLGIALGGGLAQQRDGLRLLFKRQCARDRDLETGVLRMRRERHVAAGAAQRGAAGHRFVADIIRRVLG